MIFSQDSNGLTLAVSVLVRHLHHAVLLDGEVAPVPDIISVSIRDPILSGEILTVPGPAFLHGGQAEILLYEVLMVPNVEAALLAAPGDRNVGAALIVQGDRHAVGNGGIGGPFGDNIPGFLLVSLDGGRPGRNPGKVNGVDVGPVVCLAAEYGEAKPACLTLGNLVGRHPAPSPALQLGGGVPVFSIGGGGHLERIVSLR